MTDPFDDLETQLRAKVRERAGVPAPGKARRRWGLGRGPLVLLAALGLTATGAAVAATTLHVSTSVREQGANLADRAKRATDPIKACVPRPDGDPAVNHARGHLNYVDTTVSPAITAALPWVGTPLSLSEQAATDRVVRTVLPAYFGSVIRGTIRLIDLGPGKRMLFYVQSGGSVVLQDPVACAKARREKAVAFNQGHDRAVLAWALRVLATDPDIDEQTQSIGLASDFGCKFVRDPQCGWAGGGNQLVSDATGPRARVDLGLLGMIYGAHNPVKRYYGLVPSTVTRITVTAPRSSVHGFVPHRASLRMNTWVVDLPRSLGGKHVELTAFDAAGHVVQRMRLF